MKRKLPRYIGSSESESLLQISAVQGDTMETRLYPRKENLLSTSAVSFRNMAAVVNFMISILSKGCFTNFLTFES